jgi:ketosteroid isomerase-like protein
VNAAEQLLKKVFRFGEPAVDVFSTTVASSLDPATYIHPYAQFSLFGPSGTKEVLIGRDAFLEFVRSCTEALADRTDEIIAITGIDDECALVHARAWRKSKASGEELRYEWAMLYRVENGLITYGADMLDSDAQAFWGRIRSS